MPPARVRSRCPSCLELGIGWAAARQEAWCDQEIPVRSKGGSASEPDEGRVGRGDELWLATTLSGEM